MRLFAACVAIFCCIAPFVSTALSADDRPPNVVVIFIDDMGYADINPFGDTKYPTPNLDRMANEGRRFTDFVVSSAVCSASRSALLTGCYHRRIGFAGALGPKANTGINPGRDHAGGGMQKQRVRHSRVWQMASWPPPKVLANQSRVRPLLRHPVQQRHVAVAPQFN